MATWRGVITKLEPIASRLHILGYRVYVTFEILDPGVVHSSTEAWNYDLAWIAGKTLLQIRTMVLDEGGPTKPLDPPAPPGTFTAPFPPPLRERGAAVLEEWEVSQGAQGITLPVSFSVP